MTSTESFQITVEAAEFYESAFVPAFFAQWAPLLCDAAGVEPGHMLLDVACGTGIVARTAADRVAPTGKVVGLDLNEAMLTVARRVASGRRVAPGRRRRAPLRRPLLRPVVCQMALMFFPDQARAVAEMRRVAAVDGTVAIIVPGALDRQPSFAPFVDLAARHAGPDAVSLLSSYFVCGDLDALDRTRAIGGSARHGQHHAVGTYRAPSVDAAVTTEVESTPLAKRISVEVYQRIRDEAREVLAPFTDADGSLESPFECNLVVASRP